MLEIVPAASTFEARAAEAKIRSAGSSNSTVSATSPAARAGRRLR